MKKKLQIFVSSTFTDLLVERQAAVQAILRAGNIPAGMELFSAGNKSQLETIKKWIEESDIYVLILEITIEDYWGWMPHDAWEWIKKRQK